MLRRLPQPQTRVSYHADSTHHHQKKGGHGEHHGGAWKVAYADFVTAMMALFIVLWLMSNSTKQEQLAISGYFRDPSGTAAKVGSALAGSGENIQITKQDMDKLKEQLQKSIQKMIDLEKLKKNVEMTVTAEGLRIELIESEKGTFFESGSATLNANGKEMLTLLAQQLGTAPNHVSIEGHTDAKPYSGTGSYSNWELSSDRANAARRLMQEEGGLRTDQVSQVRGFADQRLRNAKDPFDPANRRVSIIVQYITANVEEPPAAGTAKEPGEKTSAGASQPVQSESAGSAKTAGTK